MEHPVRTVTTACNRWTLICVLAGRISALPGWWNAPGSVTFYPCVAAEACPGGEDTSKQLRVTNRRSEPVDDHRWHQSLNVLTRRGEPSNSDEWGAACKKGTGGVLCGVCSDGYVLQSDGQCTKCNANTDLIVLWSVSALAFVLCLAIAYYCMLNSRCKCRGAASAVEADSATVNVDVTDRTVELRNKVLAHWGELQALAAPLKIMIGFDFELYSNTGALIRCDACRWVQMISALTSQFANVPWPSVSH